MAHKDRRDPQDLRALAVARLIFGFARRRVSRMPAVMRRPRRMSLTGVSSTANVSMNILDKDGNNLAGHPISRNVWSGAELSGRGERSYSSAAVKSYSLRKMGNAGCGWARLRRCNERFIYRARGFGPTGRGGHEFPVQSMGHAQRVQPDAEIIHLSTRQRTIDW